MNRQNLGKWGENIACQYLTTNGYTILETNKNYYENGKKIGEIDIVTIKDNITYIVEVKTRGKNIFGSAIESLTPKKIETIRRISQLYIKNNQIIRIQLIAIDIKNKEDYSLQIVDVI